MSAALTPSHAAGSTLHKLKHVNELKMEGIHRQTLDYSCGAASLSILLQRYFSDDHQEEEILADITFRLSPEEIQDRITEGFSMLDLKKAAERLGYSADGVILDRNAISALQGPVIILLRRKKINHFVVLKGVAGGSAFLADPARGNIRVPLYSLFEEWKGETLIVGRENFGLPTTHGLSTPKGDRAAPERHTVRALQNIQH